MYPSVYYNYAVCLSTLGRFDDLKELLDTAMNIPGITKATIYNEYAIMFEQQGEIQKAIEYYQKAGRLTLSNDVLDRAKNSIARCKSKLDLL